MTRLKAGLVALSVLLVGCPGPQPVKLEPITRPPSVSARVDAEVERTALALGGGTVVVSVVKAGTRERILGASVSLIGPTLGSAVVQKPVDVSFSPLISGDYRVRVSAPGYVVKVEGNMKVEPKQVLEREIVLEPATGKVSGRVLAPGGQPIWGARVRLGESWTFTGQDGTFSLEGAGEGTLSIRKGGMQPLERPLVLDGEVRLGDLSLVAAAGKRRVRLVNPLQAFGTGTVATALADLMNAVSSDPGLERTETAGQEAVRLLASPRAAVNAAEYQQFVAGGGTLVVTGEWGGFGEYDSAALNALTRPFGLAVRPDLVRIAGQSSPSDWLAAGLNPAMRPSQGLSELKLYSAASLVALPPAVTLADSGASGYRVQALATGVQTLAAAVAHGDGLVVLLGDTSAWTASHLKEAGNQQFMLNLFGW